MATLSDYPLVNCAVFNAFFIISALGTFNAKTTDVSDLKARLRDSTIIYDHENKKAGSIAGQKGTYVGYDQISSNVTNAIIATEDRNFYKEYGFLLRELCVAL
ncbi:Penicillin-binding protein 1A [Weissella viridescens]|uniref:Penicillin-binding protein 1A n=1 Tax=Weissella viridescens TaxID=1629 RepID=A0A380P3N9_WEIVI|nr:Penicillin-binding protein 1A [Weissella viridescens]